MYHTVHLECKVVYRAMPFPATTHASTSVYLFSYFSELLAYHSLDFILNFYQLKLYYIFGTRLNIIYNCQS